MFKVSEYEFWFIELYVIFRFEKMEGLVLGRLTLDPVSLRTQIYTISDFSSTVERVDPPTPYLPRTDFMVSESKESFNNI